MDCMRNSILIRRPPRPRGASVVSHTCRRSYNHSSFLRRTVRYRINQQVTVCTSFLSRILLFGPSFWLQPIRLSSRIHPDWFVVHHDARSADSLSSAAGFFGMLNWYCLLCLIFSCWLCDFLFPPILALSRSLPGSRPPKWDRPVRSHPRRTSTYSFVSTYNH